MGIKNLAHGCTGRGNDQLRFEAIFRATDCRVIAPMRELDLAREWEIDYAREHGIDVAVTKDKPWSIDENIWSRSIEGGKSWRTPTSSRLRRSTAGPKCLMPAGPLR